MLFSPLSASRSLRGRHLFPPFEDGMIWGICLSRLRRLLKVSFYHLHMRARAQHRRAHFGVNIGAFLLFFLVFLFVYTLCFCIMDLGTELLPHGPTRFGVVRYGWVPGDDKTGRGKGGTGG